MELFTLRPLPPPQQWTRPAPAPSSSKTDSDQVVLGQGSSQPTSRPAILAWADVARSGSTNRPGTLKEDWEPALSAPGEQPPRNGSAGASDLVDESNVWLEDVLSSPVILHQGSDAQTFRAWLEKRAKSHSPSAPETERVNDEHIVPAPASDKGMMLNWQIARPGPRPGSYFVPEGASLGFPLERNFLGGDSLGEPSRRGAD